MEDLLDIGIKPTQPKPSAFDFMSGPPIQKSQ